MKDKEIKEMVDDIVDNLFNGGIYRLATDLYDLGYRKIPKDSVVLTREEYDILIAVENEKINQAHKETAKKCRDFIAKQFGIDMDEKGR